MKRATKTFQIDWEKKKKTDNTAKKKRANTNVRDYICIDIIGPFGNCTFTGSFHSCIISSHGCMLTRYEEITSVISCDDSHQKCSHLQIKRFLFFSPDYLHVYWVRGFCFLLAILCVFFTPRILWKNEMQLILLIPSVIPLSTARLCHVVTVTFWWIPPHNFRILFLASGCFFFNKGKILREVFFWNYHAPKDVRSLPLWVFLSWKSFVCPICWNLGMNDWFLLESLSVLLFARQTRLYNGWWTFIDCC